MTWTIELAGDYAGKIADVLRSDDHNIPVPLAFQTIFQDLCVGWTAQQRLGVINIAQSFIGDELLELKGHYHQRTLSDEESDALSECCWLFQEIDRYAASFIGKAKNELARASYVNLSDIRDMSAQLAMIRASAA